jgi:hypothetical protein
LRDGAEVILPPDALTEPAVVTLRVLDAPPRAPIPRSIIGRAYQFSLEGGGLIGVARLTLPLPIQVSPDEYDFAAYRWNGRAWERAGGRLTDAALQLGVAQPGVFAVLGRWRMADAALALVIPPVEPGRQTTPMAVAGQYRFSALPALQHDYVPARLLLKRDISGGAGQVSGDEALDKTVAEVVLWFKPNPAQAQGVIEFSYVFEVAPADLDAAPGSTSRLYAVLIVEDAAAPTRQLSSSVEYTLVVPIRIVGADVVRPALTGGSALRWNVALNGQPFRHLSAKETTLPLAEILAQGGLGDYRIILEAEYQGRYLAVSNEVTVKLALPATSTPTPRPTPTPTSQPTGQEPGRGIATPTATTPPTPTRRVPPGERTPTPPADLSPTPTAISATTTPTRPAWASVFWADRYVLAPGECTMLHWKVDNVIAVYLDDRPVTGAEDRKVCPTAATIYTLRVSDSAGTQDRRVTITVSTAAQAAVEFTADDYEITQGKCTVLHWRAVNVSAVYLNDEGVAGEASRKVCPQTTTEYGLRVVDASGGTTTKRLTITVAATDKILMRFWAEQYALQPDKCTTLHWAVQDVQAIYLLADGPEQGVVGQGAQQVCPAGSGQTYVLRTVASDGRTASRQIVLNLITTPLNASELIGQGIVNEVIMLPDLDGATPGDQPGWHLLVDGINPLFVGAGFAGQTVLTIEIAVTQIGDEDAGPIDWPINPRQLVEFRALCADSTCTLPATSAFYLRLRSD